MKYLVYYNDLYQTSELLIGDLEVVSYISISDNSSFRIDEVPISTSSNLYSLLFPFIKSINKSNV